jgi:hypothetical protein
MAFSKAPDGITPTQKHILRCVVLGPGFYFSPARHPLFLLPPELQQLAAVIYCCEQFSCHKNEAKCIESNADLQKVCSPRSQTAAAVNIAATSFLVQQSNL